MPETHELQAFKLLSLAADAAYEQSQVHPDTTSHMMAAEKFYEAADITFSTMSRLDMSLAIDWTFEQLQ